jgi:hypothetical protein
MAFNTNFFSRAPRTRKNPFSSSGGGGSNLWEGDDELRKKEQLNQSPPFNPNAGVFGSSNQNTSYTPGIGGGPGQNQAGNMISRAPSRVRNPNGYAGQDNVRGPGAGIPGGDGGWSQNPSGNQGGGPPWNPNPGNAPGTPWTEINPRQRPNPFPGHQPPQGDGPVVGPNGGGNQPPARGGWSNFVNFNPQRYDYWRPEWMDGSQSQQDVLDWVNALNDQENPNFGSAYQDLLSYAMGTFMPMADARTAQRYAQTLDMNREQDIMGNDQGASVFGVGLDQFGLNPAMGQTYGGADKSYNSRERYQTAQDQWNMALSEILGLAGGGTGANNDNNENDILEGIQSFGNNIFSKAQSFANPGGGSMNRYAEGRRTTEMDELFDSVAGTPLEAFGEVLKGIVNPQQYYNRGSGARFGMVAPREERRY